MSEIEKLDGIDDDDDNEGSSYGVDYAELDRLNEPEQLRYRQDLGGVAVGKGFNESPRTSPRPSPSNVRSVTLSGPHANPLLMSPASKLRPLPLTLQQQSQQDEQSRQPQQSPIRPSQSANAATQSASSARPALLQRFPTGAVDPTDPPARQRAPSLGMVGRSVSFSRVRTLSAGSSGTAGSPTSATSIDDYEAQSAAHPAAGSPHAMSSSPGRHSFGRNADSPQSIARAGSSTSGRRISVDSDLANTLTNTLARRLSVDRRGQTPTRQAGELSSSAESIEDVALFAQSPSKSPKPTAGLPLPSASPPRPHPNLPPIHTASDFESPFGDLSIPEQVLLATSPAVTHQPNPPVDVDEPWIDLDPGSSGRLSSLRESPKSPMTFPRPYNEMAHSSHARSYSGASDSSASSAGSASPKSLPSTKASLPPLFKSHSYLGPAATPIHRSIIPDSALHRRKTSSPTVAPSHMSTSVPHFPPLPHHAPLASPIASTSRLRSPSIESQVHNSKESLAGIPSPSIPSEVRHRSASPDLPMLHRAHTIATTTASSPNVESDGLPRPRSPARSRIDTSRVARLHLDTIDVRSQSRSSLRNRSMSPETSPNAEDHIASEILAAESSARSPSPGFRSGFHRRSPSMGSHSESFLSISPRDEAATSPPLLASAVWATTPPTRSPGSRSPMDTAEAALSVFRFGNRSPSMIRSPSDEDAAFRSVAVSPSPPRSPIQEEATLPSDYRDVQDSAQATATARPNRLDLSMPPPSGWELSDDPDENDDSPLSDSESGSESANIRDRLQEVMPALQRTSNAASRDTDPDKISPEAAPDSPDWGTATDYNNEAFDEAAIGGMALSSDLSPELEGTGLTALERIFLFAKSEHVDHRETIARSLHLYLQDVELCEAVEYILPLFNDLAVDDDLVKEAFAENLDRLMLYFFSECPLLEHSAQHQIAKLSPDANIEIQLKEAEALGVPTTMVVTMQGLSVVEAASPAEENEAESREASAREAFRQDAGESITPGTGSTLVDHDSNVDTPPTAIGDDEGGKSDHDASTQAIALDRPIISISAFHEVLGLLLLNDIPSVSQMAQDTVVRFLLRIQNMAIPGAQEDALPPVTSQITAAGISRTSSQSSTSQHSHASHNRSHKHKAYALSDDARSLIRDTFIQDIVVALAHLDHEEQPELAMMIRSSANSSRGSSAETPAVESDDKATRFSTFFQSASSPPRDADEILDAQQGQFVTLCIIAGLAETHAIKRQSMEDTLLPVVLAAAKHESAHLRKQAVETLTIVMKTLDQQVISRTVLTVFDQLANDETVIVRRTICTMLSDVVSHLIGTEDHANFTLRIVGRLYRDENGSVQQAVLEQMGPIIYTFHGYDVPIELVDLFIGQVSRDSATPLAVPDASRNASLETSSQEGDAESSTLDWDPDTDRERAIITAYNLPGVAVTLGSAGWHILRKIYGRLAHSRDIPQTRYLIAASLHDVAGILSADQVSSDILETFESIAFDDEAETTSRVWEHMSEWVPVLQPHCSGRIFAMVSRCWADNPQKEWRMRETLARTLPVFAPFLRHGALPATAFCDTLRLALIDEIDSVRQLGIRGVQAVMAVTEIPDVHDIVKTILLELSMHGHHKYRALFATAALRLTEAGLSLGADVEAKLLLVCEDEVIDVRICAARCIVRMCEPQGVYHIERPHALRRIIKALRSDDASVVREIMSSVAEDTSPAVPPYTNQSDNPDDDQSFSSNDDEDRRAWLTAAHLHNLREMAANVDRGAIQSSSGNDFGFQRGSASSLPRSQDGTAHSPADHALQQCNSDYDGDDDSLILEDSDLIDEIDFDSFELAQSLLLPSSPSVDDDKFCMPDDDSAVRNASSGLPLRARLHELLAEPIWTHATKAVASPSSGSVSPDPLSPMGSPRRSTGTFTPPSPTLDDLRSDEKTLSSDTIHVRPQVVKTVNRVQFSMRDEEQYVAVDFMNDD